jgi:hypothetical protein
VEPPAICQRLAPQESQQQGSSPSVGAAARFQGQRGRAPTRPRRQRGRAAVRVRGLNSRARFHR